MGYILGFASPPSLLQRTICPSQVSIPGTGSCASCLVHPLPLLHPLPEKWGGTTESKCTTLQEAFIGTAAHLSISTAADATMVKQLWPQTDQAWGAVRWPRSTF